MRFKRTTGIVGAVAVLAVLAGPVALGGAAERQAAAAARSCVVPALAGDSLVVARVILREAHCTLGQVREPEGPGPYLVVTGQSPRYGAKRARGAAVSITLGRRRTGTEA